MGATTFTHIAKGTTPETAFREAVEAAAYEYGHGGYTGTIAEKPSFIQFARPDLPNGVDLEDAIEWSLGLTDEEDQGPIKLGYGDDAVVLDEDISDELRRIGRNLDSKWGPAGCIALGDDRYLFFGWAST